MHVMHGNRWIGGMENVQNFFDGCCFHEEIVASLKDKGVSYETHRRRYA